MKSKTCWVIVKETRDAFNQQFTILGVRQTKKSAKKFVAELEGARYLVWWPYQGTLGEVTTATSTGRYRIERSVIK